MIPSCHLSLVHYPIFKGSAFDAEQITTMKKLNPKVVALMPNIAIWSAAGTALFWTIHCFVWAGLYDYAPYAVAGVFYLLAMGAGIGLGLLHLKKFKDDANNGAFFAIVMLLAIAAIGILAIDYLEFDFFDVIDLLLIAGVLGSAAAGLVLMKKGNAKLGKMLLAVFLGLVVLVSFLEMFSYYDIAILGNLLRIGSAVLSLIILFMDQPVEEPKSENAPEPEPEPVPEIEEAPNPEPEPEPAPKPEPEPEPEPEPAPEGDPVAEEIKKAKKLLDDGLITEEEFAAIKERVLRKAGLL